MDLIELFICLHPKSFFISFFNYPERLRERPCDVLATCTDCYKGANSYLQKMQKR
ncbi:hypothetical protein HDF22_000099 [Mucilaginibacter lappiensis]|uniref:Uncharacterized protein n=1 Tax=Mucilaginibacter lappiensis TaxID=354630 RepID=A0A841JBP0_9SPHI|nr:hypothetical protein [Mucilaginibacter lappiensis]